MGRVTTGMCVSLLSDLVNLVAVWRGGIGSLVLS